MTAGAQGDTLQQRSRNLLAALTMLVRAVKLYEPHNAVFHKPLQAMLDALTALLADQGKVELAVVNGSFYVNAQLVRVDQASHEHLRSLAADLEAHRVGGFTLLGPPGLDELRNFVWIFAKDQREIPGENGLSARPLRAFRIHPWAELEERLDKETVKGAVDPRRYPVVLYARAVFFMRHELEALAHGQPTSPGKAVRLVQDLIDAFGEHRTVLLAVMRSGELDEILAYHLVNTALIAIAFGRELGLAKPELKELALAALMNERRLCLLPPEIQLTTAPERLEPMAQARRGAIARETAAIALTDPGASRLQQLTALSAVQQHEPFLRARRDPQGRTVLEPRGDPLYLSRLLALCASFDTLMIATDVHPGWSAHEALAVMWRQERWRFDPQLLAIFVRVMARQPWRSREA